MTFRTTFAPTLIAAALLAVLPSTALADRAFTARDLVSLDRFSSPALSPDGRKLVFAKREMDLDANKATTSLWIEDLVARDQVLDPQRGRRLVRVQVHLALREHELATVGRQRRRREPVERDQVPRGERAIGQRGRRKHRQQRGGDQGRSERGAKRHAGILERQE